MSTFTRHKFRLKKISLLLTAALISGGVNATRSIVIDDSVSSDGRTVVVPTITDGDLEYIRISASDALVKIGDNSVVDSKGYHPKHYLFPGYFIDISAGTVDLGKNFSLHYGFDHSVANNIYGAAIYLYGTGELIAENLTINAQKSMVPDGGLVHSILAHDDSHIELAGTTNLISGNIETTGKSILNAESVNILINEPDPSSRRGHHPGMMLWGKDSNFTGDVNIQILQGSDISISALDIFGNNANFAGKTAIDLSTAKGNATGIYIKDSIHFSSGNIDTNQTNNIFFNDLSISAVSHSNKTDNDIVTGFNSNSNNGNTDIAVNKIAIDAAGNHLVTGIQLRDTGNLGAAKYRINDATIKVSGGEAAELVGYHSDRIAGATEYDTVINNINVQSEGGKNVYLLEQRNTDDKFIGNVTLGSDTSYHSASGTLYSIYGYSHDYTGSTNITNNNKLVAWGRMYAGITHAINIIAGDNSYIYGDTLVDGAGTINLALNGSNSYWNMTGDSSMTNLILNGSTLNFAASEFEARSLTRDTATFKTLTVKGDYQGNDGIIVMNTSLGEDSSPTDRLVVTGNTSGNTTVKVVNTGGAGGLTTEGIELITVGGQSDGVFKQSGRIVAGAYDYTLLRGEGMNNKNWYLSSTLPLTPQPTPEELPVQSDTDHTDTADNTDIPQPPHSPIREHAVRPEAGLYGMNLQAANTLFNTRLHDRLGETNYVDALTGEKAVTSMWLRNIGGHTRQHDHSGQLGIQSNRYVMQVGGDLAQWSKSNTDRYHLGLMAGYANQKSRAENQRNKNRASSSISGYSVGLYGTWLQDNDTNEGAYVDTWAQYSWFDNTVSGKDVGSESYHSKGFTASVESGYTWKLMDISERNSLFIQPKVQGIWMGVKADSLRESNGTFVEGNGDGNIQTRAGVRVFGKGHNKIDNGKDRTFEPFVEANWLHNTRDFGTSLNGEEVKLTGTRNIGELKAGVEGKLSHHLSLWGNVGQQVGDKGYSDTSAMLGVKASF